MKKRLTESEELPVPSLDASPELNIAPRTEPETKSNSENESISTDTEAAEQPERSGRYPTRTRQPPDRYEQNLNT